MARLARWLSVLAVMTTLSVAAPAAHAAPAPQQPAAATPALRDAVLQGIQQVFPADLFQELHPRFLPLQDNLYLVSHPALYWRVEQEMAAKALAERLAGLAPGWGTTLSDGPQGYGVYLTYRTSG
jgi:hypothetical protein